MTPADDCTEDDTKDQRKTPNRRAKGKDRREGTDPETRKLFDDYGFRDERGADRRSGKDRRDD